MGKKALVVGIDHYEALSPLFGCVNDARAMARVLERHEDGSLNFTTRILTAQSPFEQVSGDTLRESVRALFADEVEVALLYFAGHGSLESIGGYLCTSDSRSGSDGMALADVVALANVSLARHKVIILDSCHSGGAAGRPTAPRTAELAEGLTILTASTARQRAQERAGAGVFTTLLVDALCGAAANLMGDVTPGSVYAHIDQALGPWDQRPVFKTNVHSFVSLRRVAPRVPPDDLRRLGELFPAPEFELPLDPSFEPESPAACPRNTATFAVLQRCNRVDLVVPVGAPHMYHAAMQGGGCRLTTLGRHYHRLARELRI